MKLLRTALLIMAAFTAAAFANPNGPDVKVVDWEHFSSLHRDLPFAGVGYQVSTLIFDVDKDGLNDFVIAGWDKPSMVWFKRTADNWETYLIDEGTEYIEAGGDFADIDGDGDLDIVQGGDWRTLKEVWWWENPYPDLDPETPWKRYHVKNSDEGGKQHHDQMFGDFDGDGANELVFWNTSVCKLFICEIPDDPKSADVWEMHLIHQFDVPPTYKYEGLAKGDIDNDGLIDIIGGGHWFKYVDGHEFEVMPIDPDYFSSRTAFGDLIEGGYPEVVISSGDDIGSLNMYEYDGSNWTKTVLIDEVIHGHTLQIDDVNADGHLDIFTAEMAAWGNERNFDAHAWVLYGDGKGNFLETIVSEGICHHESKLGDLDGDGDLDILGKPFFLNGYPMEIWLNNGAIDPSEATITHNPIEPQFFSRKVDGPEENWYGPFSEGSAITDVDNDGVLDIVAGANWYKGPDFKEKINFRDLRIEGEFVSNGCDHAVDFNQDGLVDIISNGWFDDQNVYVWLNSGDPEVKWEKKLLIESEGTEFTFFEDIDGDGDKDLIPNHWVQTDLAWYEYDNGELTKHVIGPEGDRHGLGFGDINGDGRTDIVTIDGWYEAPEDPKGGDWTWHPDFRIRTVHGSMPMLVYDVNGDGKNDIIYGEAHAYGLYWIEQKDGGDWEKHAIDLSGSQVHALVLFDVNSDGVDDLITGKRLRGHSGRDPGSYDPLGVYWYEIDKEEASFKKNVIAYNARIGTGMQINLADLNGDEDVDIVVSGKSGLYILENMLNFERDIEKIDR